MFTNLRELSQRHVPVATRNSLLQLRNRLARASGRPILRELAGSSSTAPGTFTATRVNDLLKINSGTTYLEIGVFSGETLEAIACNSRVGVDPYPVFALDRLPDGMVFHRTTSDNFFEKLGSDVTFDAILLDGLHEYEQTYRDLRNSLRHLSPVGFIVIDDTVPSDATAALPSQSEAISAAEQLGLSFPRPWMGDVFRVVYEIFQSHPDLQYFTYIGDNRHQTVVWPGRPSRASDVVPNEGSAGCQVDFSDDWAIQLPSWFAPGTSVEIEREFELHRAATLRDGER